MAARGVVLADAYRLDGATMKWSKVKRSGYGPTARAGFSMVLHKQNAVMFGGVEDDETEEDMQSTFYNDMFALNLDRRKWFPMTLRKKKGKKGRRRRRKGDDAGGPSSAGGADENEKEDVEETGKDKENEDEEDDGKELDTAELEAAMLAEQEQEEEEAKPCGRFNAMVAVQKNVMYIAGGMVEKGDQEVTLDDIWGIDLNKLDEFVEVKPMSQQCLEWVASDEEDEEDEDEEDGEWEEADDMDVEEGDEEDEETRRKKRGGRRERLRERIAAGGDGDNMTPRVNESLKDFFERSKAYWIGEVHEALGESGKALRRVAFEWAFKRYWEIKPTLRELEAMEAELAAEAAAEAEFARKQADQKRSRTRR